jgi:hypothetical protein
MAQPAIYQYYTNSILQPIKHSDVAVLTGEAVGYGLGYGYSSDYAKSTVLCLNLGATSYVGSSQGVVSLGDQISEQTLASQLHISVNGSASAGTFSASASSSFYNSTFTGSFSQTFIYQTSLKFKSPNYNIPQTGNILNRLGQIYQNNPIEFRKICGNKYINQLEKGGSLYILVKLNFLTQQQKQAFDASVGGSVGFGSLSASIQKSIQKMNLQGDISIKALQIGGNPSQLGKILQGGQSTAPVLQCSFKNLTACTQTLNNVLTYATGSSSQDFPQQFPSTATAPDPALAGTIGYSALGYAYAGVPISAPSQLTPQVIAARNTLASDYHQTLQNLSRANFLDGQLFSPKFQSQLQVLIQNLKFNKQLYQQAGDTCFSNLGECVAAETNAQSSAKLVNTNILNLPVKTVDLQFKTGQAINPGINGIITSVQIIKGNAYCNDWGFTFDLDLMKDGQSVGQLYSASMPGTNSQPNVAVISQQPAVDIPVSMTSSDSLGLSITNGPGPTSAEASLAITYMQLPTN